jgi:hypothetical protein
MHERNDDRRRTLRVCTPGKEAVCKGSGLGDIYDVEDLSLGGAKLRLGPLLPVGTPVSVAIFDQPLTPLHLSGTVIHHESEHNSSFGVAFDQPNVLQWRRLHDIVSEAMRDDYIPADYLEHCPP